MSLIGEKKDHLRDFEIAKDITSALRGISALKLQSLRIKFNQGKSYFKEVENLYRLIKLYAGKKNIEFNVRRNKTPKILLVAITSNKRFYGSLNNDVMREFLQHVVKKEANDFFVIGRTGKQYMAGTKHEKQCRFFEFNEDTPNPNEIVVFIDTTRQYDHVFMFYPQFVNVFKQNIVMTDITYIAQADRTLKEDIEYIFEPELNEISWFFDTQVRYILFTQTMLEVELSRTAARLIKMNASEQNAIEAIKETRLQVHKAVASLNNMRLLEIFSGVSQWKENKT